MKGIYLSNPHGKLIHEDKKTLIAVAKRIPIEGERVVCSKENGVGLAYGKAIIGDPLLVDVETFDERFSAHRVPRASRLKWWPDAERLYLYPIRYFMPFSTPLPIEVPPGITMDMSSEVKFLEGDEVPPNENPTPNPLPDEHNLVIMSSSGTIENKEKKMPWEPSDALEHTKKADTPEKRELWASTANSRLETCVKEGGDRKECEASAVRVANAAVAKQGEKQRAELPDSAFLYVEPGGKKADGKTEPDSLRHLPYKKADGSLDLPHLRNALSRLGQPDTGTGEDGWLTPALRKRLQIKAKRILEDARKKSVADLLVADDETDELSAIKAALVIDDLLLLVDDKAGDDGDGETHVCTCPNCGTQADADLRSPCREMECPSCGARMRGGSPDDEEEKTGGGMAEKAGRRFSSSILEKLRVLKDAIVELVDHGEYADQQPEPDPVAEIATQLSKGFKTLGVDGQGRTWFMIAPTNAYFDREGEAFATKALNDYVNRHADQKVKGEAWFWHVDGSKFGTIQEQAVVGEHFVAQFGTYDDTVMGNAFKQFFTKYPDSHPVIAPNGWGASHQYDYFYEDRKDNVYEYFDIQESTVLPLDVAANVFNLQPVLGGLKMNDQQKAAIAAIGEETGVPDLVEQIVAQANQAREELDAQGKPRKSMEEKPVEEREPEIESAESEDVEAVAETEPAVDPVKAVVDALQLDLLSKALEDLTASVKAINERLDTVESTVNQTEAEIKAKVADEIPRYSWFRAPQAEETVSDGKDTPNIAQNPVVQGLVGMMKQA